MTNTHSNGGPQDVQRNPDVQRNQDVQRNKALVKTLTEQAFNHGRLADVEAYFSRGYQVHAPGVPPLPPGPEAFVRAVSLFRAAMPDIHVTVEDLAGEGDRVFGRFTTRGTHTGVLMGIPPTGRPVVVYEWVCHRFVDGQVAESWIGDNLPRILLAIGAAVPRGPAAEIIAGAVPAPAAADSAG